MIRYPQILAAALAASLSLSATCVHAAGVPANIKAAVADSNRPAADTHYKNVTVVVAPLTSLAPPMPVDLVFTSQNYHDLHNFPVDVVGYNKGVLNSLKPGGLYVVLDHSAAAGSGLCDTKTLHRI